MYSQIALKVCTRDRQWCLPAAFGTILAHTAACTRTALLSTLHCRSLLSVCVAAAIEPFKQNSPRGKRWMKIIPKFRGRYIQREIKFWSVGWGGLISTAGDEGTCYFFEVMRVSESRGRTMSTAAQYHNSSAGTLISLELLTMQCWKSSLKCYLV